MNVWKEVFLAGTDWDQFGEVAKIDWDFGHLDEALEEGDLSSGKVYLFGCTEPQLIKVHQKETVVPIPAIVAIQSKKPPPSFVGIKSVQRVEEEIVPMERMKMGWYPFIPSNILKSPEKFKPRIYVLKCEQRRAGLRNLSQDSLKKYEYVLPYIVNPDKQEDDTDLETTVNVVAEVPGRNQPLVFEYDWELDDLEEFVSEKLKEEELPESVAMSLKESILSEVKSTKRKKREENERKRKVLDNLSEEDKDSLRSQRVIKFYPQGNEPDISTCKTSFINRYYGHAQEVR
ncbi:hypothetical protein Gasu2_05480 [Galdieria sulphuraria]|uniref:Uncharacterized protein n=1 Tax=Galdieria sulphuraria TaxID=130081 RepID=M2Y8K8_GALSU|nr:uncharacterized protein Gasu_04760 [Galdieria sulphuraria]EME32388.1 hypothetical protein Gasu_04760 [Galdieria sulphuraria]GJD06116.1 hypothetical protein Gasu2_05480 [Galdieria sulphuraria]|eukprot:XP_005708908.1 hypothetical protein Gasu_04760 [Galdieria sulphuraria]